MAPRTQSTLLPVGARKTIVTLFLLALASLALAIITVEAARSPYGYRPSARSASSAYNSFASRMRPTFGSSPGFPNGLRHMMPPPPMSPFGGSGGPFRFGPGGGGYNSSPFFQPPAQPFNPYGGNYASRYGSPYSSSSLGGGVSASPSYSYSSPSPSSFSTPPSVGSMSSSANSFRRPVSSRPGSPYGATSGYRRRPPPAPVSGGYTAAPAGSYPESVGGNGRVHALPPTSAAPVPTSAGALGPTVSNDSDIGFDIPASSSSDSSSLAGPTVSESGSGASEGPRTGPLSSASSSSLVSSDGFDSLS